MPPCECTWPPLAIRDLRNTRSVFITGCIAGPHSVSLKEKFGRMEKQLAMDSHSFVHTLNEDSKTTMAEGHKMQGTPHPKGRILIGRNSYLWLTVI